LPASRGRAQDWEVTIDDREPGGHFDAVFAA